MPMADNLPQIYQDMINTALAAKPADMTITTHVCRGNFRSTWVAEGGYEPVAERLLGAVNSRRLFPRIRHRPRWRLRAAAIPPKGNKTVVLGLVTSKSGTLESKGDIKRRIEEAAKLQASNSSASLHNAASPSTEEGNILAEEEQWAKLRMIVDVANEVWGRA
jgi:5-methyltetrahydropteroyltriglutamate--homocysteine methyltransferase